MSAKEALVFPETTPQIEERNQIRRGLGDLEAAIMREDWQLVVACAAFIKLTAQKLEQLDAEGKPK